jgi:hypothetical protein
MSRVSTSKQYTSSALPLSQPGRKIEDLEKKIERNPKRDIWEFVAHKTMNYTFYDLPEITITLSGIVRTSHVLSYPKRGHTSRLCGYPDVLIESVLSLNHNLLRSIR